MNLKRTLYAEHMLDTKIGSILKIPRKELLNQKAYKDELVCYSIPSEFGGTIIYWFLPLQCDHLTLDDLFDDEKFERSELYKAFVKAEKIEDSVKIALYLKGALWVVCRGYEISTPHPFISNPHLDIAIQPLYNFIAFDEEEEEVVL